MTRITRAHLDFAQYLARERDRCQAAGVREYAFTIGEYDLNYAAKILRRMAELLGGHGLGRIRRVVARPGDAQALSHLVPDYPVAGTGTGETEVVVDFAIPGQPDAAPQVSLLTAGPIGIINLSRPKALNALTLPMIRAIEPQLRVWAGDPTIKAVVIQGEGGKAFCAGGDVLAIYDAGLSGRHDSDPNSLTVEFFREEYTLNHLIHRFPKPFIALADGICMGGGVGLSAHGSYRVVTERTLFAMPETGIGLFPDVGGGWFLARFPGQMGVYLGLTGARCKAAECMYLGYATHFVPRERIVAIPEALVDAEWPAGGNRRALDKVVGGVLARFAGDPGPSPLAVLQKTVDRCFGHDTVEAIMAALEAEGTDWARDVRATMAGHSPTALKVALHQILLGARMTYEDVVTMEYRLSQGAMAGHDFYEGIRALLVDKDKSPQWRPARLSEVSQEAVDAFFAPLGDRDLVLPAHAGYDD